MAAAPKTRIRKRTQTTKYVHIDNQICKEIEEISRRDERSQSWLMNKMLELGLQAYKDAHARFGG